jgi:hypothetical protein
LEALGSKIEGLVSIGFIASGDEEVVAFLWG